MKKNLKNQFYISLLILSILLVIGLIFFQIKALFSEPAERTMTLLAASGDSPANYKGEVASISLKVKNGDGKVVINTEPLTQLDTQISMRFAQQSACDYLKIDCSNKDFFYKIKASSQIIGGPSAGAAATILTISTLSNKDTRKDVAMTGTINSGGAIGAVGTLKEKIDGAASNKISKVLIPEGIRTIKRNETEINLSDYGSSKGIKVIEVSDIDQALVQFGIEPRKRQIANYNDSKFKNLMKNISDDLCSRTLELSKKISFENRTNDTIDLLKKEKYYAASSFCFIDNIRAQEKLLSKLDDSEINKLVSELKFKIKDEQIDLKNQKVNTISTLQTNMIIAERLKDAEDAIKAIEERLNVSSQNKTNNNRTDTITSLAFAIERMQTIESWKVFYTLHGKEINLDDNLKNTCSKKISEAEERLQYANLFARGDRNQELDDAKKSEKDKDYALCIYQASKAKAEISADISTIGATRESIDEVTNTKLRLAEQSIKEKSSNDLYPILANSWVEYGYVLTSRNQTAAGLLYAEYALELSDLSIYFPEKQDRKIKISQEAEIYFQGIITALLGFFLMILLYELKIQLKSRN